MTATPHDPIAFELFKNTLFGIADEMALTIFRTAYSGVLKDVMDYSTAFCDADGKTVAQGLTLPAHLCSVPDALAAIIPTFSSSSRSSTRASGSRSRRPSATRPTWAAASPGPMRRTRPRRTRKVSASRR
jgi:hypothetical protein